MKLHLGRLYVQLPEVVYLFVKGHVFTCAEIQRLHFRNN